MSYLLNLLSSAVSPDVVELVEFELVPGLTLEQADELRAVLREFNQARTDFSRLVSVMRRDRRSGLYTWDERQRLAASFQLMRGCLAHLVSLLSAST